MSVFFFRNLITIRTVAGFCEINPNQGSNKKKAQKPKQKYIAML